MADRNYFKAIATLSGTIIGVGIFSVPFVVSKSGLIPLLVLLTFLAYVQYLFHMYYAEIIMATEGRHRLPGYVADYFGKKNKVIVAIIVLIGNYGSLLAYVILGGIFLNSLLQPILGGSIFLYSTILFLAQALIVLYGLKLIAKVEFLLTGILVIVLGFIFWKSFNFWQTSNYLALDWQYALLPYGPIFFAVGGGAAIPEVYRLLEDNRKKIKSAIAWGTFLPACLTLFFTLAVVGVTGRDTTPDALIGLSSVFSPTIIKTALVFGLLSIVTSFLVVAQAVKEIFIWDLNIARKKAWLLALLPVYLFFLSGAQNLTRVVSFTGAVTGGLIGIILIWLFFKVKNDSPQGKSIETKISKGLAYFLSLLFFAGFIYSLLKLT